MITKERLYKQIEKLPDKFKLEELIEKLLLINKLEKRISESDNEDTMSQEELDNEIEEWSS